jgi:WD40 repeat protein
MRPEQRPLKLDQWSLSPDGRRVAFVDKAGVAGVCDVASGEVLDRLPGLGNDNRGLLFAADGRSLYVAKRAGDLWVWNPPEQRRVRGLAEKVDLSSAETSQDGRLVVASDQSARIHVWRTDTWLARMWEEAWQADLARSPPIALSPDGHRLAVGLGGGIVRVMDPWTGRLLRAVQHGERATRRVAFSTDSRFLAASSLDASVTIWETSAWRQTARLNLPHAADSLAFSPDRRRLALGSQTEQAVKLWDTTTWRELLTLEAPGGYLWQLVFTPDGSRLLGSNEAGDLLVWSAPSGNELDATDHQRKVP